ncbi:MAG: hypothetical protein R8K22_09685 [Mariprofundaceae bacterium]
MLNRYICIFMIGSGLIFSACSIAPKIELVSKQTALERQLMGSMADLDKQSLLMTPVRGKSSAQALDPYRKAIAGRAFRLDEIESWLKQGYVAEHENGTIKKIKVLPKNPTRIYQRFHRLVADENRDRSLIIDHLIHNSLDLSPADKVELGKIFHQLRLKELPDGAWVENMDGKQRQVHR